MASLLPPPPSFVAISNSKWMDPSYIWHRFALIYFIRGQCKQEDLRWGPVAWLGAGRGRLLT
jgi:hypothetical protein